MSLPEDKFHENLVALGELIKELIAEAYSKGYSPVSPELVQLGCELLVGSNKKTVIENFIDYSHEHWKEIKDRNEIFFIQHADSIFRDLPQLGVNAFKQLFTMKDEYDQYVIGSEDRGAIWDFFSSLVKISIHYAHETKIPIGIKKNNEIIYTYQNNFIFPRLDVLKEAKIWNITNLKFKV